jgi:hypothetical protein
MLNKYWTVLRAMPDDALPATIAALPISKNKGYSVDELVKAVRERRKQEAEGSTNTTDAMKAQEYEALMKGRMESREAKDFVCEPLPITGKKTRQFFERVMVVKRLREVRALNAFARILPPTSPDDEYLAALYVENPGWLPGIEVIGEGVFIEVTLARLAAWERGLSVQQRAEQIDSKYRERFSDKGTNPDRKITPRLLLVHTLAHALINEWSLDSGYPASSLRERLYSSPEMAGILIYTATSDSAGSLGGVIAEAQPERLEISLEQALARTGWCSNDPLCSESDASGVDSLNLAACHACILLPEVSCEEMNVFLDRGLLIGTAANPDLGLFSANQD